MYITQTYYAVKSKYKIETSKPKVNYPKYRMIYFKSKQ